jgi:hypothetical protein
MKRLGPKIPKEDIVHPRYSWEHAELRTSEPSWHAVLQLIKEEVERLFSMALVRV